MVQTILISVVFYDNAFIPFYNAAVLAPNSNLLHIWTLFPTEATVWWCSKLQQAVLENVGRPEKKAGILH